MPEEPAPRLSGEELAALERILAKLGGASGAELPWPLFRFVTEVSATANVDLLVRDERNRVLLAWREDPFGRGWHVPGSIIRHREDVAHRIAACCADEFGTALDVDPRPAALIQIFDDRGHSVSLVFPARPSATPGEVPGRPVIGPEDTPGVGDLRWFEAAPDDLYPSHEVYREVLAALDGGTPGIAVFTQRTGKREGAGQAAGPGGTIGADTSLTER